jgi:hypothetical protein
MFENGSLRLLLRGTLERPPDSSEEATDVTWHGCRSGFALCAQHCERILSVMSYRCTGLVFRFECYDDGVRLLGRHEQSSHHDWNDEIGHSSACFNQHGMATDRGRWYITDGKQHVTRSYVLLGSVWNESNVRIAFSNINNATTNAITRFRRHNVCIMHDM